MNLSIDIEDVSFIPAQYAEFVRDFSAVKPRTA